MLIADVPACADTPGLVTTPHMLVTSVTNTKYCHTSSQRDLMHSRQGLWMLEAQTMDELSKICPKLLTVLIFTKLLSPITHSFEQNLTN